jgi:hypothetical protein
MFNHHPACVFGLRCTGCNFAEMTNALIVILAPDRPIVFAEAVGDAFERARRSYRDTGLGDLRLALQSDLKSDFALE